MDAADVRRQDTLLIEVKVIFKDEDGDEFSSIQERRTETMKLKMWMMSVCDAGKLSPKI